MLKMKILPEKAPSLNQIERLVEKPFRLVVCTNHSYSDIDDAIKAGRIFLTKYKQTFGT